MNARHFCFAALIAIAGCSNEPPTAPKVAAPKVAKHRDKRVAKPDLKLPENFDELVTRIQEYDDQIQAAIKAGTPDKAHHALDELDLVLERAIPLAKKFLPDERLADVDMARRDLHAAFMAIHDSIDEKKQPDYSAQAEKIEAAIEVLKVAGG